MLKGRFGGLTRAFVLLLLAALSLCAPALSETTSGYVRVYGSKDVVERDDRKFAPYAVLPDEAHSKKYALRYIYYKTDNYTRTWELRLVKADGHRAADYDGRVDVYLPYPSIWSNDQQAYWKWSREYCSRFDWTVEKTLTVPPYTILESQPIEPKHSFGFLVSFFEGIPGLRVTIRMEH